MPNNRFAYVTLLTSEDYLPGALVLAASLKQSGSIHEKIVLIPENTLSPHATNLLTKWFDQLIYIPIIRSQDTENLRILGRPELDVTLSKLNIWNADLFEGFERLAFLDADVMVMENIDAIFDYVSADGSVVFAAAPDIGWPDCFNSGVFVTIPNQEIYADLIEHARSFGSFDGGDQGVLNSFFFSWSGHHESKWPASRLPFGFNVTPSTSYSYLPAYIQYFNDIRAVHFIGRNKPWRMNRSADGTVEIGENSSIQMNELVMKWWRIFDNEELDSRGLSISKYIPPVEPIVELCKEALEPQHFIVEKVSTKKVKKASSRVPHSGYDFSFTTSPGVLPPSPPPAPQLTATGIPLVAKSMKKPVLVRNLHLSPVPQAPADFGKYKVGWNPKEISRAGDQALLYRRLKKLSLTSDVEIQKRELHVDSESPKTLSSQRKMDNSLMKEINDAYQEYEANILQSSQKLNKNSVNDSDRKYKTKVIKKWFGLSSEKRLSQDFTWNLSGGSGKYKEMFTGDPSQPQKTLPMNGHHESSQERQAAYEALELSNDKRSSTCATLSKRQISNPELYGSTNQISPSDSVTEGTLNELLRKVPTERRVDPSTNPGKRPALTIPDNQYALYKDESPTPNISVNLRSPDMDFQSSENVKTTVETPNNHLSTSTALKTIGRVTPSSSLESLTAVGTSNTTMTGTPSPASLVVSASLEQMFSDDAEDERSPIVSSRKLDKPKKKHQEHPKQPVKASASAQTAKASLKGGKSARESVKKSSADVNQQNLQAQKPSSLDPNHVHKSVVEKSPAVLTMQATEPLPKKLHTSSSKDKIGIKDTPVAPVTKNPKKNVTPVSSAAASIKNPTKKNKNNVPVHDLKPQKPAPATVVSVSGKRISREFTSNAPQQNPQASTSDTLVSQGSTQMTSLSKFANSTAKSSEDYGKETKEATRPESKVSSAVKAPQSSVKTPALAQEKGKKGEPLPLTKTPEIPAVARKAQAQIPVVSSKRPTTSSFSSKDVKQSTLDSGSKSVKAALKKKPSLELYQPGQKRLSQESLKKASSSELNVSDKDSAESSTEKRLSSSGSKIIIKKKTSVSQDSALKEPESKSPTNDKASIDKTEDVQMPFRSMAQTLGSSSPPRARKPKSKNKRK